jgi:hypothetical protein
MSKFQIAITKTISKNNKTYLHKGLFIFLALFYKLFT